VHKFSTTGTTSKIDDTALSAISLESG